MGIPSIVGYPMPAESELPDTVVPWRPDAGRAVLLIHDMQRYFVDFFPPGEPMNTLVRNAVQLRRAAVDLGVPVVYTAQPGKQGTGGIWVVVTVLRQKLVTGTIVRPMSVIQPGVFDFRPKLELAYCILA